jgi:hypothetical protein
MPGMSLVVSEFNYLLGIAIAFLMSMNVFGAIMPFYIFRKTNPLKVYVSGMLLRTAILGGALAFFYIRYSPQVYIFLIICITTYVIFQAIEINHLVKNKGIFQTAK